MKTLVVTTAVLLVLATTFADARQRHPRGHARHVSHYRAYQIQHYGYERPPSLESRCSDGALSVDPLTACFRHVYLGRDPDMNVRFELRRDYARGAKRKQETDTMFGAH